MANGTQKCKTTKKKAKQEEDPKNTCPDCMKLCDDDSDGIRCDICEYWFHALNCQGLKKSLYDALRQDEDNVLHWYCKGCKRAAGTISQALASLSSKQEAIQQDIAGLKSSVKLIEEGTITESLQKTLEDIIDRRIEERIPKATAEIQSQQVQQTHRGKVIDRSKNLIVFKEEESEIEDMTKVKDILADKLGIPDMEPESTIRLGKKAANQTRPIRITMKSVEDRSAVLTKLKEMRVNKEESLKSIFITPDLSRKERERQKLLRSNLRERRGKGEKDLVIRRGRIISAVQQSQSSDNQDG